MGKGGGLIRNGIRTLRFHHDEMTQQDLADRVGVTRQTINAIEGNKYSPSLEVAFRIAHVFDVPLESVFQYADDLSEQNPLPHYLALPLPPSRSPT
jgi:putative transcriptional regulator